MIPLTLRDIAMATSGEVVPAQFSDSVVTASVVTDSREALAGSLYIARQGEHADGHDYVEKAMAAGATAALVSRVVSSDPCVVVPDVQEAFAALAREVYDRCLAAGGLHTVGITGSSGKTSTKDLMAQVVQQLGPTLAPIASYNSEVGVPLTVCRLESDTQYLIAEMGASGVGHIEYLTRIAPPQIGVVLNVGSAHLGEFGTREAIAHTKAELVRALPAHGLAVLNADDAVVAAMAEQTSARVITVGRSQQADIRATDVSLNHRGQASFTMHLPDEASLSVELGLHGEHHVGNALSAAAVAREWGMAAPDIAAYLGSATPSSRWRMEVTERADQVTIVNDAYNANPDSMRAALRALASMRGAGRAIAVVGEMRELGQDSQAEHEAIGAQAADLGLDLVLSVGPGAAFAAAKFTELGLAGHQVDDVSEAMNFLAAQLQPGDVVLLKSSRDSGLRLLGDDLAQQETAS